MSRLMEEPKRHIHDKLCSELNEMSIRIKVTMKVDINTPNYDALVKRHPMPTWDEVINLIERCRDEMNQCTEPYRIR